jgi:5,6-dimethylbenzimidazole synthase
MHRIDSNDFTLAERGAVYRAMAARRDVRADFVSEEIDDAVLMRVLAAAHMAPSVGLSQPWRFLIVRDAARRARVHAAFLRANDAAAAAYAGDRAERYRALRLEGIRTAPVNICVTCDDSAERGAGLGRHSMPEMTRYSTVCAIQNLWLAARVEGLGVGWVSIIEPEELRAIFSIPAALTIVAYLCVGYTSSFAEQPDLERARWERRVPLSDVIDRETYQSP